MAAIRLAGDSDDCGGEAGSAVCIALRRVFMLFEGDATRGDDVRLRVPNWWSDSSEGERARLLELLEAVLEWLPSIGTALELTERDV